MWLSFVCFLCFCFFFVCVFLFLVSFFLICVSLCPFLTTMSFAGYFLARFLLSAFSSSFFWICSWFGLVWFCLSYDHGWIRRGSVNVRYNNNNSCSTTIPAPVAQSLASSLFIHNAYPVLFMNLALCFVARM